MEITLAPTVSIILPNYNHELFLSDRIDSILSQSFQDFEIILLDDCSTDNSIDILNQYVKHPKVKCLKINSSNSGSTFYQWAYGFKFCQGKYIWIAESDDVSHPNFLISMIKQLEENKNNVMAYCQSLEINEMGETLRNCEHQTESLDTNLWQTDFNMKGKQFIVKHLSRRNCIPNVSAVLFHRNAFDCLDQQITTFCFAGDWLFYIKILKNKNISFTPETLNYQRMHLKTTRYGRSIKDWGRLKCEVNQIYDEIEVIYGISKLTCKALCNENLNMINLIMNIIPTLKRLCYEGKNKIAIYSTSNLGYFALNMISSNFTSNELTVSCFIDKRALLQDYKVKGIPVFSLTQFSKKNLNIPIFIASTVYFQEIYDELNNAGLADFVIEEPCNPPEK